MEESRFLFFKLIVSVVMSYISYFFLTGLIFGTVAVFFVILINLGLQDFSVQFFRLFSFIAFCTVFRPHIIHAHSSEAGSIATLLKKMLAAI